MTHDPSDPKQVRKAQKVARFAERQRGETVRQLMSTTSGRSFVHDKLAGAHIFATSFALNALQMAFNEGERNQGLQLLADIMQWCPEQYTLMMREENERASTVNEQPRSAESDGGDPFADSDSEDDDRGGPEGGPIPAA